MNQQPPTHKELTARVATLEQAQAELDRELAEARQQQEAVAEVLRIISRSPDDLDASLQAVAEATAQLCRADVCRVWLRDGDEVVVGPGVSPEGIEDPFERGARIRPTGDPRGWPSWQAEITGRTIHIPDMVRYAEEQGLSAERREHMADNVRRTSLRTVLSVPLRRGETVVGVLGMNRIGVRPFTDREIALAESFADQAVIAIENARLFEEVQARNRELTETLEYQTATSEVLQIISQSPTDVQPVLDAIVQRAKALGEADESSIWRIEGDEFVRWANTVGRPLGFRVPNRLMPNSQTVVEERRTVAALNLDEDATRLAEEWDRLEERQGVTQVPRNLSGVGVPLVRDGRTIAVLAVGRFTPRPFSDKQIALLETFAAQAVIAIENTRLFEELQERNHEQAEALEHQRATGEILAAISRSPTDLPVVLETIGHSAMHLCQAERVTLFRVQDGQSIGAYHYNPPEPDWEELVSMARPVQPGTMIGAAVLERRTVEFFGTLEDLAQQFPRAPRQSENWAHEARLAVPLLANDEPLGAFVLTRKDRRFTPSEVALIETFADQAVIAIANARLFEELQTRTRELEAASQAQREFLSRMSHELRTPLNAIIGFAEIMEMDPATTLKQHERVEHILRGGRHLLGLINEVLDIARIEAGRLSLSLEPVALDAVLGEVLELIRPIAIDADVDLQVPDPSALQVAVQVDKGRLRQIILNLVTNGVKYNHPGGSVTLSSVEGPDGLRRLTVRDTGPGIAADEITRLFAPFERLSADQSGVEGTGLGLAIAKRLAQAMGGDIGVESVVGQGSLFWLDLPAASLPLDVPSAPEDETPLTGANGAARAATVLYIEDNLPNVELVQHILGFRPGVTLLTAPRAEVGLRLAGRYQPDLILLDLNLPDIQGDEALARLRADPRTAAIPVVMVSADATESQIQRLLAAGARDYLTKPLDVKRFLAFVDEQLDKAPGPTQTSTTPDQEAGDESR